MSNKKSKKLNAKMAEQKQKNRDEPRTDDADVDAVMAALNKCDIAIWGSVAEVARAIRAAGFMRPAEVESRVAEAVKATEERVRAELAPKPPEQKAPEPAQVVAGDTPAPEPAAGVRDSEEDDIDEDVGGRTDQEAM